MQDYQAIIQEAVQKSNQGHLKEALIVLDDLFGQNLPKQIKQNIITQATTISKKADDTTQHLTWIDRGITMFPESPQFFKLKADYYFEKKSYTECIPLLNEVTVLRKDNKWDFLQRGHCFRFLGKYDLAEKDYLEVSTIDPSFFPSHISYAQMAKEKKEYVLYAQRCEKLVLQFPSKLQAHTNLAYAYLLDKDYNKAIIAYQNAISQHPDDPKLLYGLANTYAQNNQDLKAKEVYIQALPVLNDPQQILHVGNRLITYNEIEAVKEAIVKLAELHPDSLGFYLLQCQYYEKTQEYIKGLKVIEKVPASLANHTKLNLYKIKFLQARFQHNKAYKTIQKLRIDHPENTDILLLLAKHYQLVHNYKEAIQIYEEQKESMLPYPYLFFIDTVYQSGDQNKVKQELARYINVKSYETNAYYYTLLVKNKLALGESIRELYSEIMDTSLTPELISLYSMGLQDNKETKLASQFLEEVSNLETRPSQQRILAHFEKLRIANINEISALNNQKRVDTLTGQCYQDVKDIIGKSDHSIKSWYTLQEKHLTRIKKVYPAVHLSTKVDPYDAIAIAEKVVHHIKHKQPLSLIRLGDGEGNFFDYPEDLRVYQEDDQTLIQRIWWGDSKMNDEKGQIQKRFFSAIDNADIIGTSETVRLLTAFDLQNKHIVHPYLRASRAVTVINEYLAQQNDKWIQDKMVTSCFIHQDLQSWNLYQYIFKHINACSIITCHTQASTYLKQEFGLDIISNHIIPAEHRWSSKMHLTAKAAHYPYVYQQLRETIKVTYPGELYLVAAGFLGKEYCDIIKRQGGIALDVGSILDYWFQFETRSNSQSPFHNLDIK